MKITINQDDDVLELSTENLDDYNFVDVTMKYFDKEFQDINIGFGRTMTVDIDKLYTAVKALKEHADRAFDKERKYER